MIADDPDLRRTALEIGVIDTDWLDHPDRNELTGAPPLEVTRRFLERTVERRPSALSKLGLDAVEVLSWDALWERGRRRNDKSAEVNVVFTDLEGFTHYTAEHGDEAAIAMLAELDRVMMPIVRTWGGRVVKRLGDGLMLVFTSPTSAVRAAVELVHAVDEPLRLRAGAHTGTAVIADHDIVGHVVNVAARVTDEAVGGQILITEELHDAVEDVASLRFDGPWSREVRGLTDPVTVYTAEPKATAQPGTAPAR